MDLRCNKTNCKHNDRYSCTAKEIHISETTDCKTYKNEKGKPLTKISNTMFEQAPEIAPFRAKANIEIKCKADCLFNKNGKCNANGISVLDGKKDGICGTFIES